MKGFREDSSSSEGSELLDAHIRAKPNPKATAVALANMGLMVADGESSEDEEFGPSALAVTSPPLALA